jgi:hypothetical protein
MLFTVFTKNDRQIGQRPRQQNLQPPASTAVKFGRGRRPRLQNVADARADKKLVCDNPFRR